MRFVAIDVETANPNMSSICQIGIVLFENGVEVRSENVFVDPQTWFDPINIDIHGIDESMVAGAPTFEQLNDWLCGWTAGEIVVCHTHFDRIAVSKACEDCSIAALTCTWLDTARVTRRAWPQFAQRGYGIANIADHLGFVFKHHDAREDARTAGLVMLRAILESGQDLTEWVRRASQPIGSGPAIARLGDGDGGLLGEIIVFTGALQVARRDAADRAADAGADVQPGVTRTTTMLVVGDQDIAKLNGHDKSGKHIKAEALIKAGQPIRIVGETDFMALCAVSR